MRRAEAADEFIWTGIGGHQYAASSLWGWLPRFVMVGHSGECHPLY